MRSELIALHACKSTQIGFHAQEPFFERALGVVEVGELLRRRVGEEVELDLRLGAAGAAGDVVAFACKIEENEVALGAFEMLGRASSSNLNLPFIIADL